MPTADFTPTTETVRAGYITGDTTPARSLRTWDEVEAAAGAEFDRWLAEHVRVYTVEKIEHFEDYPDGSIFIDDSDGTVYRLEGWTTSGGYFEPAEIKDPIVMRVDGVEDEGWSFPLRHVWSPEQ